MVHEKSIGVNNQHLADLRASGLSDDTIRAAHVRTETDAVAVAKLLGWKSAVKLGACLVFPFFGADGTPNGYAVAKPDNPVTGAKGKLRKYESPKGQPLRPYVPPTTRAVLADVSAPLLITEGCKKALKANQEGFACIGLSGVYGWCAKRATDGATGRKRGPLKLNPELAAIAWSGRAVYIVFDSDAATNPEVRRAERKLAELLRAAGALVKIVRLPAEPGGVKNGLDDYLVRHGKEAFAALVASAQAAAETATDEKKPPSAADVLVRIGLTFDLWHDSTQTAYTTAGRDTRAVRSKTFKHLLVSEYFEGVGKPPNAEALSNALVTIEAHAIHKGPESAAHVRVAGHNDRVYLHLADNANTVIEIDSAGWRECEKPPVHFRKPPGMRALPKPQPGGRLDDLRRFINCPDDSAFALVKAWLSGCFRPGGPFPLLVLTGEQGSAKSTTGRVLKRLIDPATAPLRSEPKEARDLMIAARNAHVCGLDNLSHLPAWLSDCLCRLATGGGFATRELYTNDDETIFDATRPTILNGIENFVSRSDLLERSILLSHPPISEKKRKPESELWAAFDAAHGQLLGALLDRVAAGLCELPRVKLDQLPRMADFALFAVACERGAGELSLFGAAYAANQSGACEQALESSPIPPVLVKLMEGREQWGGTATELLDALTERAPKPDAKDWPKAPNALTNKLRRLAPDLRRVHRLQLDLDGRTTDRKRTKQITIARTPATEPDATTEPSSAPSASSESRKTKVPAADDPHPQDRSPTTKDRPQAAPGAGADDLQASADDVPGKDRPQTDRVKAQKNKPTGAVADDADGSDDVSPSVSDPPVHTRGARRRFANDDTPHERRA